MESENHLCILITQGGWPWDSWENYNCNQSLVATLRNWDNTPTESWFGSFKNERVHGERFGTRDEMKAMAFEYIEVLQPETAALDIGLPVARTVHARLDKHSIDGKQVACNPPVGRRKTGGRSHYEDRYSFH